MKESAYVHENNVFFDNIPMSSDRGKTFLTHSNTFFYWIPLLRNQQTMTPFALQTLSIPSYKQFLQLYGEELPIPRNIYQLHSQIFRSPFKTPLLSFLRVRVSAFSVFLFLNRVGLEKKHKTQGVFCIFKRYPYSIKVYHHNSKPNHAIPTPKHLENRIKQYSAHCRHSQNTYSAQAELRGRHAPNITNGTSRHNHITRTTLDDIHKLGTLYLDLPNSRQYSAHDTKKSKQKPARSPDRTPHLPHTNPCYFAHTTRSSTPRTLPTQKNPKPLKSASSRKSHLS